MCVSVCFWHTKTHYCYLIARLIEFLLAEAASIVSNGQKQLAESFCSPLKLLLLLLLLQLLLRAAARDELPAEEIEMKIESSREPAERTVTPTRRFTASSSSSSIKRL